MDPNNKNRISGRVKNWFTWALLALLPGLTGWFIVLTQEQIQQNRSETYKFISRQQKDEFLEMYHEWSQLTPHEKAENPWGTGPYGGPEIQKKLLQNQEERLLADLPDLLSSENNFPIELGDILYGPGWRGRLEEYRKQIEYREILSICSWILVITGILGLALGIALWILEKVINARSKEAAEETACEESKAASEKAGENTESAENKQEEVHLFTKKRSARSSSSAPPSPPPSSGQPSKDSPAQPAEPALASAEAQPNPAEGHSGKKRSRKSGPRPQRQEHADKAASVLTEVLAEETEAPQDPAMISLMTPEPVARELTDLTEQMSAIREFAAEQQTQVKKLQDGYDWMLIKRFCLRMIRCIDNVDDRIRQIAAENKDTSAMEDIRDEMVFALESSGVEPYEPEVGRDYRGLEKYAEAVKERKENDDPEKTGKIAEIVRPGYQYLISDEEVKIVRCAQVKLYA